jgi:glycosyltransferase involved in cell wall biosynthesis
MQDRAISFQKGNVEDLKNKLEDLLTNNSKVAAYKNEAQSYICGKYNWDEVVGQTLRLYK